MSSTYEYRYSQEISQMMFVFADLSDPHPDVVKLVEDIVRSQVLELIIQSRALSQRRGSRFVNAEDLIFLIRDDRAKVNRLKTYLSWKDVRKNAKDSEGGDAAAAGPEEEGADAVPKTRAKKIRLPWEISTVFTEHLVNNAAEEDEEDEEDVEALEESLQRLKDADEATRKMTRDEYVHYSECRQASFTFRKAKKFREFINAGAYLDGKPNDDMIDILGFLAFEVVRELCEGALKIKQQIEEQTEEKKRGLGREKRLRSGNAQARAGPSERSSRLVDGKDGASENIGDAEARQGVIGTSADRSSSTSPHKRKMIESSSDPTGLNGPTVGVAFPPNKRRAHLSGMTTSASTPALNLHENIGRASSPQAPQAMRASPSRADHDESCTLFTMPPIKTSGLDLSHIQEAFARLQRKRPALGVGGGGISGGLRRTKYRII
ncbi:related to spt3-general transcriptional adaptor or co-activator [Ceraceosorus bombacis]|uniref:Related to spt3-general transcriptional adaptor or co-activator n=1 Tax=Ceraceosorus bombacis TaxID=401625 RepID=A0A0N7L944_9BASI|nr:related to spt3-general transcriptional adaptor or co-activator [Ceraceosorus bombacis]